MDKYVTVGEFEDFKKYNDKYINAIGMALFKTLSSPEKWEEFCFNLDGELIDRNISPGELSLDYHPRLKSYDED